MQTDYINMKTESTNLVDGDDRSCEVLQAGKYHEADGLANNRRPGSVGKYGKVGAAIGVVGLTIGLSVGLTGNSSSSTATVAPTPIANEDFEISAYLGVWFQAHASRGFPGETGFQDNCVTADYSVVDGRNDAISVLNGLRGGDDNNEPFSLNGFGTTSPDSETTLQVDFFVPEPQAYADPNYVIFGLGPQNDDGLYSWAAITNGDDDRLFILARDIADFKANYEDDVIEFAKSRGFIFEGDTLEPTVVIPTNQEGCVYNYEVAEAIPNESFDVAAYLGSWLQAYVSRDYSQGQQFGGDCVSADYSVVEGNDNAIEVLNTVRIDNTPISLPGFATISPDSDTTLQVNIRATEPQPFEDPNYIIIGLGPLDANGLYAWTAITEKVPATIDSLLYILVRNVDDFQANYEQDAIEYVTRRGFIFEGSDDDLTVVEPTNQENC